MNPFLFSLVLALAGIVDEIAFQPPPLQPAAQVAPSPTPTPEVE